jgi:hypothetical protein
MTLLAIASRNYLRGSRIGLATTITRATTPLASSNTFRFYTGPEIKVSHYEYGRELSPDKIKEVDKYCTQTFNKISEVVGRSS